MLMAQGAAKKAEKGRQINMIKYFLLATLKYWLMIFVSICLIKWVKACWAKTKAKRQKGGVL